MADLPDSFTSLKSRRGKSVHAVSVTCFPLKTVCGKKADGWQIVPDGVDCPTCIAIVCVDIREMSRVPR